MYIQKGVKVYFIGVFDSGWVLKC